MNPYPGRELPISPPPVFDRFVAIDWSGAVGERHAGIAIAQCCTGIEAPELASMGAGWSRAEVVDWLNALDGDVLVGMDISPAFPFADRGSYFPGFAEAPGDARALWALVEQVCRDEPYLAANAFVDHPDFAPHFRRHGGRTGAAFGAGGGRLRVVEHRQRTHRLSPTSCFNLVGPAQVGKASLTAMRVLHRLKRATIWPFDAPVAGCPVIVEIYTALAAREAGLRAGTSKLRDGAALDAALAAFDCAPHRPLARYTDHATDAILAAAWLRHVALDRVLWNPPGLAKVAATEGWTFGVR